MTRAWPGRSGQPAVVLASARAAKQVEEDAARRVMRAAAAWASMHSRDSLVGPADGWHESGRRYLSNLRDHTGTLDVTPDTERRVLARTFTEHLWSADP